MASRMAKKRVTADELSWIVQQELWEGDTRSPHWVALAVVPDEKRGWRVLIPRVDLRSDWTLKASERLPKIEQRLRGKYALRE